MRAWIHACLLPLAVTLAVQGISAAPLVVLSTSTEATLGEQTCQEGDLAEYDVGLDTATVVLYDPNTDTPSVFLGSANLSGAENIDAFELPEPSTAALLGLGLARLACAVAS